MNRTRRMIGLSVLVVMLVVLGTGWALERASTHSQLHRTPADEPAKASNPAITPVMGDPVDVPAATDEYDRSDLILMQG